MTTLTHAVAVSYYQKFLQPYTDRTAKCEVATREYDREARFANLFTAVFFALVAATAIFLVIVLGFLLWGIVDWSNETTTGKIVKFGTAVVTAAGSFLTGQGSGFVKDAATYHETLAKAANEEAVKACATPPTIVPN